MIRNGLIIFNIIIRNSCTIYVGIDLALKRKYVNRIQITIISKLNGDKCRYFTFPLGSSDMIGEYNYHIGINAGSPLQLVFSSIIPLLCKLNHQALKWKHTHNSALLRCNHPL